MDESQIDQWRAARDRKMFDMLDPDEPAWLVSDELRPEDQLLDYTVVHRWAPGGWARRRYTYDYIGDVVHFRGSSFVGDSEIANMKREQRIRHPYAPA